MRHLVKYIGHPYVVGGRSFEEGLDCWGLCREFYKGEFGIDLPEYQHIDTSNPSLDNVGNLITDTYTYRNFDLVEFSKEAMDFDKVAYGDIILFNIMGNPLHTAIALDKKQMLHSHDRTGSVIERFTDSLWVRKLRSFHRYKKNSQ